MIKNPLFHGAMLRLGYGALSLFAPDVLLKSLGAPADLLGDQGRYFNRLVGGRELMLGAGTICSIKAGHTQRSAKTNLILEAADTVALVQEARLRGGLDATLARGLGFNVVGYLLVGRALKGAKAAAPPADAA
jgi:hypothetical protein